MTTPPTPSQDAPVRIGMHEGSVAVPAAFEDRSTHLFVPADPQQQPNLSVARDWLHEDEALAAYVDRQLAQLKSRVPGHKLLARTAETLGAGDGVLEGERIDAQYRSGAQTIRQRQAVFLVAPRRALIFTLSTPRPLDDGAEQVWRDWLSSYLPAAPEGPRTDPSPAADAADAANTPPAAP